MKLTREEVQRLAELARLSLDESEMARAEQELGRILEYVGRLARIDTAGIPETEPGQETTAWRADVAPPSDEAARALILSNFPDRFGELLKVPAVFDKPKG
jgi:aspartyl-tRNA(Asn)/glutamyl-tRNA(Gln) amidotransferase subunit C